MTLKLRCSYFITLGEVKLQILQHFDILPCEQRLWYNERLLPTGDEHLTLGECEILPLSHIEVIREVGGSELAPQAGFSEEDLELNAALLETKDSSLHPNMGQLERGFSGTLLQRSSKSKQEGQDEKEGQREGKLRLSTLSAELVISDGSSNDRDTGQRCKSVEGTVRDTGAVSPPAHSDVGRDLFEPSPENAAIHSSFSSTSPHASAHAPTHASTFSSPSSPAASPPLSSASVNAKSPSESGKPMQTIDMDPGRSGEVDRPSSPDNFAPASLEGGSRDEYERVSVGAGKDKRTREKEKEKDKEKEKKKPTKMAKVASIFTKGKGNKVDEKDKDKPVSPRRSGEKDRAISPKKGKMRVGGESSKGGKEKAAAGGPAGSGSNAAPGRGKSEEQQWTCRACTFLNNPLHLQCDMCGSVKAV